MPDNPTLRDDLDFMLPAEVAKILRLTSVKHVYEKKIRKQYDGRRVLYRRSDVVLYLASQQAPKSLKRRKR